MLKAARSAGLLPLAVLAAATLFVQPAWAAPNAIRDAEIEHDIATLAAPIWRAAGLDPHDVAVYLVDDSQINSFVAGGQAIFINTGLVERAQNADQLMGV